MAGADIAFCVFNFTTTSASDNFNCTQRHTSGYSIPQVNTVNNIINVATKRKYDEVNYLVDLEAVFAR